MVSQIIRQSLSKLFNQSVNQSICQSINQSINQSTNQSVNQSDIKNFFTALWTLVFLLKLVQVMLTLMGDEASIPWRVLSIDFLVQDMESGGTCTFADKLQSNNLVILLFSLYF